jgi:proline dehydrogenase
MESSDPAYKKLLKRCAYGLGKLYPIKPQNVREGAELCRVLQEYDLLTTLGRLSKFGDDPVQIVSEYQAASMALLNSPTPDGFYLSVKPPAIDFDSGYAAAIAAAALLNGHGVHFDSHKFYQTDATLGLLQGLMRSNLPSEARQDRWRFSLSVPTRWKRSMSDARWAVENGVRIRLVKGDFAAESNEEVDSVQGFLNLVDHLAGKVPCLALATHDSVLAREAVARCKKAGTTVHLELFFGRPASAMLALSREMEVPAGFYVPYGDTLLVYVIKDLLTNPLKLLRRDSFEVLGSQKTKLTRITRSL